MFLFQRTLFFLLLSLFIVGALSKPTLSPLEHEKQVNKVDEEEPDFLRESFDNDDKNDEEEENDESKETTLTPTAMSFLCYMRSRSIDRSAGIVPVHISPSITGGTTIIYRPFPCPSSFLSPPSSRRYADTFERPLFRHGLAAGL